MSPLSQLRPVKLTVLLIETHVHALWCMTQSEITVKICIHRSNVENLRWHVYNQVEQCIEKIISDFFALKFDYQIFVDPSC